MSTTDGRVLIIEDHELLADALAVTLGAEGMDVAIADISDRDALLAEIDRNRPRVTLLDLDLGPPIGDGTQLIPHLLAAGSVVLVVTGLRDRVRIATAIEAGAAGYLPKSQPFERLAAATRDAAAGRPVLPDAERHELLVLLDDHRRLADSRTRRSSGSVAGNGRCSRRWATAAPSTPSPQPRSSNGPP